MFKDSLEIRTDQKFLHEAAAKNGIFDVVTDECAVVTLFEGMFVNPQRVGAFGLSVDETVWRVPDGDLALPANGDTAKAQAVI